jgi:hypothetical protein
MADIARFLDVLEKRLAELAEQQWAAYRDAAITDGTAFVDKTKADLVRWAQLLASGALSKDDFAWLLQGKKDLAQLEALEQAGLSCARLEEFRNALVGLVIDTAFSVFL